MLYICHQLTTMAYYVHMYSTSITESYKPFWGRLPTGINRRSLAGHFMNTDKVQLLRKLCDNCGQWSRVTLGMQRNCFFTYRGDVHVCMQDCFIPRLLLVQQFHLRSIKTKESMQKAGYIVASCMSRFSAGARNIV